MEQLDLFAGVSEISKPAVAEKPAAKISLAKETNNESEKKVSKKTVAAKKEIVEEKVMPVKTETAKQETAKSKRGRKSFKEMDAEIVHVEVPEDEVLFQKKYYAISEVAGWFHVNQSLIRYWENEFTVLKPKKTRKGDRLFRPEDIKNLQIIYYLLRQRKFSIEGARQYLKENKGNADKQLQVIQSLTKLRSFLLEWKANLGA